jgi:hypothetical protein
VSDRAAEIIARGDPEEIVRMALGARFAAEDGRYCECEEPSLHGLDLMCGNCLLENESQIEARTKAMHEPHAFVPDPDPDSAAARTGMCRLCAGWRDDPRHAARIRRALGEAG